MTAKLPLTSFPKIWLDFPDRTIKNIRKNTEFDNKLKQYFLNDLADQINCNRIFCPSCSRMGNPN